MVTLHTRVFDSLRGGTYGEAKRFDKTLLKSIDNYPLIQKNSKTKRVFDTLRGAGYGQAKRSPFTNRLHTTNQHLPNILLGENFAKILTTEQMMSSPFDEISENYESSNVIDYDQHRTNSYFY